jgi:methylated-DNA-[protein]-cysteine S-methyltransferase
MADRIQICPQGGIVTTTLELPTVTTIDSPVGPLTLTAVGGDLTGLSMDGQRDREPIPVDWPRDREPFRDVTDQLDAYFAGRLRTFELPMRLEGTDFQRAVWAELCRIPYGETVTYGELAARIGNTNASRAVGLANGRNPVGIIVPCHRVIGADGSMTGYGGGVERKVWLLEHERGVLRLGS